MPYMIAVSLEMSDEPYSVRTCSVLFKIRLTIRAISGHYT